MKERKPKLKSSGTKTYKNTHGKIYRVITKPNYKVMRKNLLRKQRALKAQTDA
ncbi:MAG: hypothetical protein ABSG33_10940 [Candidatus Bathyarchaeia archaeon]|jgi:hypothetical protein